jgi:hypothetical protein
LTAWKPPRPLGISLHCLEIGLKLCAAIERVSTVFALTINGGSVLIGPTDRPDHLTWRLWNIIRKITMPITLIHPGEHLAEELEALDMSASELARKIDVPANRVTQILNGTGVASAAIPRCASHIFLV